MMRILAKAVLHILRTMDQDHHLTKMVRLETITISLHQPFA